MMRWFTVLVVVVALGACEIVDNQIHKQANEEMKKIERQVAEDSVKEYEITKQGGDAVDICVHAGMAAAAWLQANDQAKYNEWKQIEKADCKAAGL